MSAPAIQILVGELVHAQKISKRVWNAIGVPKLSLQNADAVSDFLGAAITELGKAAVLLEGGPEAGTTVSSSTGRRRVTWDPGKVYRSRVRAPAPQVLDAPSVIGLLDDVRRTTRRCREALRPIAPYLDGFLDRMTDQTSCVIRALRDDIEAGMAWWNSLTEAERLSWATIADSAVAADAWAAFKADRKSQR
ncbi:MAG: hypothetical protein WB823_10995 [Steroidobacteraceae bacterium]